MEGLAQHGVHHAVGDKPADVPPDQRRFLAPVAREGHHAARVSGLRLFPADNLHKAQYVGGLAPVNPQDALRMARALLEFGDRDGRGVAADNRLGLDRALDLAEHLPLGGQVLDGGLDHNPAAGQSRVVAAHREPLDDLGGIAL